MKTKSLALLGALAFTMTTTIQVNAMTCSAKSGDKTLALVELYTSEGCDSCPPADRWLSGLKTVNAGRAVPLSMHVDYWDYIGWHDPYAQALFAARQREISAINRERTVYTPQVLVAGKDFRAVGIFSSGLDDTLARVNRTPPRADLGISMTNSMSAGAARELKLDASAKLRNIAESRDAAMYLAVFENGLSSSVAAGENKGKLLKHDFVVREWAGPFAFGADGTLALTRAIALKPAWKTQELGVAMFVQNRSTGEILQALQLAACN